MEPTNILAIWGATSPMNPMVPVKPTMVAVIAATTNRDRALTRLTSTPRLDAPRSPVVMSPMLLERSRRTASDAAVTATTIHTLSHEDGPSDPMFHM